MPVASLTDSNAAMARRTGSEIYRCIRRAVPVSAALFSERERGSVGYTSPQWRPFHAPTGSSSLKVIHKSKFTKLTNGCANPKKMIYFTVISETRKH